MSRAPICVVSSQDRARQQPLSARLLRLAVGMVTVIAAVSATTAASVSVVAAQGPEPVSGSGDEARAPEVPVPSEAPGPSDWEATTDRDALRPSGSPTPVAGGTARSAPVEGDVRRLQVKFAHQIAFSAGDDGRGRLDDGPATSDLDRVLASTPGLAIEPLFARDPGAVADPAGDPVGLDRWFVLTAPTTRSGADLDAALRALGAVEMVQPDFTVRSTVDPIPTASAQAQPVPAYGPIVSLEERRQGYLDQAPLGIDAEWAWSQPGGTGEATTIAVIDSGFDLSHADMTRASDPGVAIAHAAPWETRHGLHVLGILVADDDDRGLRGIVPDAGIHTVTSGRSGVDMARAIQLAVDRLGPGDVITISQGISEGSVVLPLIYSSVVRDALRVAAAEGIITVVSAGNGGADLDEYADRLGADAPDTIVVGAGAPGPVPGCSSGAGARGAVASSNRGRRVDLQGWGSCTRTAAPANAYLWWGFTSAATPVVAGAAASLSSMVQVRSGVTLSGEQVRTILRDTGTPQTGGGRIGPLPDLRAAMGEGGPVPVNDRWASAAPVREVPSVTRPVDTAHAGVELGEPEPSCASIGHTVWFEIEVPRALQLTIDTDPSDHDTVLAVWRRSGRRLVEQGCNDDRTGRDRRSRLVVDLVPGTTYYVQAGGAGGASGALALRFRSSGSGFGDGCDLDGDGLEDLIVGDPDEGLGGAADTGRVVVVPGSTADHPEVAVGITQEWVRSGRGSSPRDRFGTALACGDFDGDGFDDLAIGTPGERVGRSRNAGAVQVMGGSPSGIVEGRGSTITQGSLPSAAERGDRFGAALAAGDFDGDGFDDLAVASPGEDRRGARDVGLVQLVYGSPGGLGARSVEIDLLTAGVPGTPRSGDALGAALAGGDIDFDGRDELVVGIPGRSVRGRARVGAVLVVAGAAPERAGRGSRLLHQGRSSVPGRADAGDRFGAAVAVGRLGADVFADVVVGVPGQRRAGAAVGAIEVFTGGGAGVRPDQSAIVDAPRPGAAGRFGAALALGDLDGDGLAELVAGAPGAGAGAVVVIPGSRGRVDARAAWVVVQGEGGMGDRGELGDLFGAAVAVVDLDADGSAVLAIGVPGESLRADRSGRLLLRVGRVALVGIDARGPAERRPSLTQSSPPGGVNERDDRFGSVLLG